MILSGYGLIPGAIVFAMPKAGSKTIQL